MRSAATSRGSRSSTPRRRLRSRLRAISATWARSAAARLRCAPTRCDAHAEQAIDDRESVVGDVDDTVVGRIARLTGAPLLAGLGAAELPARGPGDEAGPYQLDDIDRQPGVHQPRPRREHGLPRPVGPA